MESILIRRSIVSAKYIMCKQADKVETTYIVPGWIAERLSYF